MPSVYKWTDYYDGIRKVRIEVDENGQYDGSYVCDDIGCGVCTVFGSNRMDIPPDQFFDTQEEAYDGFILRYEKGINRQEEISEWLGEQQSTVVKTIESMMKRIIRFTIEKNSLKSSEKGQSS